ncbi:hypothetical protein Fmac_030142 [Flemingia macrophylla]|uniref:non-specific serine/threonine protein kinase n=1 Tax=Flemingia macrophylla TaxID=520843 RepID=A0ABD1LCK1_9FABA
MSKTLYYFLSALSIILVTCHANTTTTACAPSNCGNLSIRYPFWKKYNNTTDGEFCGYPDFGLECYENKAIMTLPTDQYYVTDINYNDSSITLVDIDVVDQPCPRARHNVSLQNIPSFSLSKLDLPLSFYFNCSFQPSSVQKIECMTSGRNQSYVFTSGDEDDSAYGDDLRRQCQDHVVVIVKQDEIENGDLLDGFGGAMQKGFLLDWNRAGNCAECEQTGGNCRFNTAASKESSCICSDGRIVSKTCKKGTLVLSFFMKIVESFFGEIFAHNNTQLHRSECLDYINLFRT